MSASLTELEKAALTDSLYLGQELVRESDVQLLLSWAAGIRLRAHLLQEVLAGQLFPAVDPDIPGVEMVSFYTLPWTAESRQRQCEEVKIATSTPRRKVIN